MKKEIIICIIIIVVIIIGDILLQKYTKDALNFIEDQLWHLKQSSSSAQNEEIEKINDEWDKRFNILTCFVAHNELEKVKTQLVAIKAGIEVNDEYFINEEIDKTVYLLNHISDKHSLRIDNVL